jgi:pimeloyl-ACP methyl ester carboxylesterase
MLRFFAAVVLFLLAVLILWRWRSRSGEEGRFPVGTVTLHFDLKQANPPRSVTAPTWYPAAGVGEKVPVADGRFPVLLYFPGWGGKVTDNASALENLARHGFVVVGVSYPEGAGLPDPAVPMQFVPDSAYAAGTAQGNRMVQIEAEDGSQVLDALGELDRADPNDRFTGHLETNRAGVLGYSLGGSVAAQAALHDPRFLAVMNLDGWMFGDVATQFFSQPYLVISDALAPPTEADLNSPDTFLHNFSGLRARDARQQTAQLQKSGGYRITIAGSSHFSFSDHARANENNAGPIDPSRAMQIVGASAADFFGKFLLNRAATLLDRREIEGPEVKLELFPPPG